MGTGAWCDFSLHGTVFAKLLQCEFKMNTEQGREENKKRLQPLPNPTTFLWCANLYGFVSIRGVCVLIHPQDSVRASGGTSGEISLWKVWPGNGTGCPENCGVTIPKNTDTDGGDLTPEVFSSLRDSLSPMRRELPGYRGRRGCRQHSMAHSGQQLH